MKYSLRSLMIVAMFAPPLLAGIFSLLSTVIGPAVLVLLFAALVAGIWFIRTMEAAIRAEGKLDSRELPNPSAPVGNPPKTSS